MDSKNEEIEIKLLITAIKLKYGYDFSHYSKASFNRRIRQGLKQSEFNNISELIPKIIYNKSFFAEFVENLSVNVTEMFRNPQVYRIIRKKIIPYLKHLPFIKIWSAGISTGEEVYSLAILLKEEGIYNKSLIYATDFNDAILKKAKKGIYPIRKIKQNTKNYQESGGKESFADYYHADYNSVIFDRKLKENIVFANHDLVTDNVFGEMDLIFCRNVLIYFDNKLQNHVLQLFEKSLCQNGFLCLGTKETIDYSDISSLFVKIDNKMKIYQKKYIPDN